MLGATMPVTFSTLIQTGGNLLRDGEKKTMAVTNSSGVGISIAGFRNFHCSKRSALNVSTLYSPLKKKAI
jgi:hypothetical protein